MGFLVCRQWHQPTASSRFLSTSKTFSVTKPKQIDDFKSGINAISHENVWPDVFKTFGQFASAMVKYTVPGCPDFASIRFNGMLRHM